MNQSLNKFCTQIKMEYCDAEEYNWSNLVQCDTACSWTKTYEISWDLIGIYHCMLSLSRPNCKNKKIHGIHSMVYGLWNLQSTEGWDWNIIRHTRLVHLWHTIYWCNWGSDVEICRTWCYYSNHYLIFESIFRAIAKLVKGWNFVL